MLQKAQVHDWLKHPVTQSMLELLQMHKDALKNDLMEYALNTSIPSPQDLGMFKGQILACEKFIGLKEALLELSEEYDKEDQEDDVQSLGTKSPVESQKV